MPIYPTETSGKMSWNGCNIPNPARRIGTTTRDLASTLPVHGTIGVSMFLSTVSRSRVASNASINVSW